MGAAVSSNVSSQLISASTDIITTAYQNCQVDANQFQQIVTIDCDNVQILDNTFKQFYAVRADCVQNTSSDANIQNNIQQQASQLAQAVTQQFGLGTAVASDMGKNTIELVNNIQSSFTENCATKIASGQTIKCVGSNNVEINGNVFDQSFEGTRSCMQDTVSNNQADTAIKQIISQTAKAKEANFLSGIIGGIALILILGIIFMLIYSGSDSKGAAIKGGAVKIPTGK